MRSLQLGTLLLVACAAFGSGAARAPLATQAAGSPMTRSKPEVAEIRLEVELYSSLSANYGAPVVAGNLYSFKSGVAAIPVLTRTSWCDTDFTKMTTTVFVDGRENKIDPGTVFERPKAGQEAFLKFSLAGITADSIRMQTNYRVQRWKVTLDERAAAAITWPREWPAETQVFLRGEPGINPEDPAIKALAEGASPGGARTTTPYQAARNAVIAVLSRWKSMTGDSSEFGPDNELRGIGFSKQAAGLAAGRGTPVELAATCVAAVRALGIPARIVHCLQSDSRGRGEGRGRQPVKFRSVCEFYLPSIGWVPFDPIELRGQNAPSRAGAGPIKGFGNVTDLEKALPLAFRTVPEGFRRADREATWGWNADPGQMSIVDENRAVSRIRLSETGRGNGSPQSMPAPVD